MFLTASYRSRGLRNMKVVVIVVLILVKNLLKIKEKRNLMHFSINFLMVILFKLVLTRNLVNETKNSVN